MFKVSLPSTHSNISNFCIHFQASPSASDSLTHTSISASVCVCEQAVSCPAQVCVFMEKKYQARKINANNLLYISKCKEPKPNPFHYPATSASFNSPVHTQRVRRGRWDMNTISTELIWIWCVLLSKQIYGLVQSGNSSATDQGTIQRSISAPSRLISIHTIHTVPDNHFT